MIFTEPRYNTESIEIRGKIGILKKLTHFLLKNSLKVPASSPEPNDEINAVP